MAEVPTLHLFIVIPHPEDDGMVPRTFDMLTELGASGTMAAQRTYIDGGGASQDYDGAKGATYEVKVPTRYGIQTLTRTHKVLDRPSMKTLQDTLGLKVSVARLRTSGLDAKNQMAYREIYIHSKLMLIDDVFVTLGSANLNQRSMSVDSEINIAATGQALASDLRKRVFMLHSGGDIHGSGNRDEIPMIYGKWRARMKDNLVIQMKGMLNMQGFLLPFEDHRATSTMHASITSPSVNNTATV
jgi:phospholipase D1/2